MNERELFQAILEKHPSLIEEIRADEREKTIDEFVDAVLNNYSFTILNEAALKYILEDTKKDMMKKENKQ